MPDTKPASNAPSARADVVIGGGGFAGLALGVALRQALGEPFRVVVADPSFAKGAAKDVLRAGVGAAPRVVLLAS